MSGQPSDSARIPLPGGARAAFNAGGVWYCAHPDWEGSSRLTSSPSRTETGDRAYSPYGATYAGASLGGAGGSWPGAFAGHWDDAPDNLDDAPYRLLAPMMEFPQEIPLAGPRWLSPDTGAPGAQLRALGWKPAGLAAVNPANPRAATPGRSTAPWGAPVRNAYAYVADQPLSFTDPLGLRPLPTPPPNLNLICLVCGDQSFWYGSGANGPPGLQAMLCVAGGVTGENGDYDSTLGNMDVCASLMTTGTYLGSGGTDAGSIQARGVKAEGPTCAPSGAAPSPEYYAAAGGAADALEHEPLGVTFPPGTTNVTGLFMNAVDLLGFRRGGAMDAQVRYGGSQAYASYAFGDYMAAAGFSLTFTLAAANGYAAVASRYPGGTVFSAEYTSTPAANIAAITAGFDADSAGGLCSPG
ncbi:MAG: hypothetical protein ACRD2E_07935 [Terriglobales bacterium]